MHLIIKLNEPMNYPIIIIPVLVGCTAQFVKFLLLINKNGTLEFKYMLGPGHMPSAHTAFVVSLMTIVAYFDGIFSTTFAISTVLSYIVIYDAANIRTNIGYNGKIVNRLIREIPGIEKESYPILKEVVGHKPIEILVGAILGFVLTIFLIILLKNF